MARLAFFLIAILAFVVGSTVHAPQSSAIGLPGVPGVPGVPNPNDVIKGAAAQQIINALNKTISDNEPIRSSADKVYATVAAPPGPEFGAGGKAGRVSVTRDGLLTLSPGDYSLNTQVFCMKYTSHSPMSNTFRLAPLEGKWADIIAAVQSRAVAADVPHPQTQLLSWQLQAGLKYQELSPQSKALVDRLIPEFRPRLNQSFYEMIQATWSKASSTIPGVPSMDSMLDQLGDAGRFIRQLEYARNTLISYADDYQSVARLFVQAPQTKPETVANTAWSIISDRVYARLINNGDFRGPGVLEVRVMPVAHANRVTRFDVASAGESMAQDAALQPVADNGAPAPFPAGADVGVPGADVQPLGIAPEAPTPGPSPSPTSTPCSKPAYGGGVDGVPGGDAHHPFKPNDPHGHPGTDVFAQRDTPVYVDVQPHVSADALNAAGLYHSTGSLNIPESGDLELVDGKVSLQPWLPGVDDEYGGIVRLTLEYKGESGKIYPIAVDYLHLITDKYNPRNVKTKQFIDNSGNPIAEKAYKGCIGLGPDMKPGAALSVEELAKHPLIGYLGATENAHTHIQATFSGHNFDPAPLLASN